MQHIFFSFWYHFMSITNKIKSTSAPSTFCASGNFNFFSSLYLNDEDWKESFWMYDGKKEIPFAYFWCFLFLVPAKEIERNNWTEWKTWKRTLFLFLLPFSFIPCLERCRIIKDTREMLEKRVVFMSTLQDINLSLCNQKDRSAFCVFYRNVYFFECTVYTTETQIFLLKFSVSHKKHVLTKNLCVCFEEVVVRERKDQSAFLLSSLYERTRYVCLKMIFRWNNKM